MATANTTAAQTTITQTLPLAAFKLPKGMKKRAKAARKTKSGFSKKCGLLSVVYALGCEDGEREARVFYQALLAKNPADHGGRLGGLMIDVSGLDTGACHSKRERSYRRGFFVGLSFALECEMYRTASKIYSLPMKQTA